MRSGVGRGNVASAPLAQLGLHAIGMLVASYYCGNFAGLNRPSSDDIQRCVLEEANKALSKAPCHVPGLAVTLRPYETET